MTTTAEPLAALALAAALLTSGHRHGSVRLHDMFSGPAPTSGAAQVRRVVLSVGVGLLVWALTGAATAGALTRIGE